jgi:tetratricopeptide (TPR) repeat protein
MRSFFSYRDSLIIALLEKHGGPIHQQVLCLNDLATIYTRAGNYKEAKPLYQRALALLGGSQEFPDSTVKAIHANYHHLLILLSVDEYED